MYGRYRRTTREEELARIYHIPIPSPNQKIKIVVCSKRMRWNKSGG
jgi:hypothetical protein